MLMIVAECGVNFRDLDEAIELIHLSKMAGADIVKFQVYEEEQVRQHPRKQELIDIKLDMVDLKELKKVADDINIEFMATPMFSKAIDWLESLDVKRYKIRYADRYNEHLIQKAVDTKKPVYVSCDYDYHFELSNKIALKVYYSIYPIFCQPEYPPKRFVIPDSNEFYGYSNHFPSIYPPIIAAARGLEYIEIHVKKNYYKNYKPIDYAVSLTFTQFSYVVLCIRKIHAWLKNYNISGHDTSAQN